jgi:hypothetical protein
MTKIDESKFILYECCKHCQKEANMCPNKHWYPCTVCDTKPVNTTVKGST